MLSSKPNQQVTPGPLDGARPDRDDDAAMLHVAASDAMHAMLYVFSRPLPTCRHRDQAQISPQHLAGRPGTTKFQPDLLEPCVNLYASGSLIPSHHDPEAWSYLEGRCRLQRARPRIPGCLETFASVRQTWLFGTLTPPLPGTPLPSIMTEASLRRSGNTGTPRKTVRSAGAYVPGNLTRSARNTHL